MPAATVHSQNEEVDGYSASTKLSDMGKVLGVSEGAGGDSPATPRWAGMSCSHQASQV